MVPAYFLLAYAWAKLVGQSVLHLRILSVMLSVAANGLLYDLARRMYGRTAGLIAAFCFAFSPQAIYQGQEIRVYSMVLFLALASSLSLWRFAETNRSAALYVNMAVNAILMWTHLFASFLVVVECLWLTGVVRPKTRILVRWLAVHLAFSISVAYWIRSIDYANLAGQASWIPKPSQEAMSRMFLALTGLPTGLLISLFPGSHPVLESTVVSVLLVLVCIAPLAIFCLRQRVPPAPMGGPGPPPMRMSGYSAGVLLLLWWLVPQEAGLPLFPGSSCPLW